MEITERIRFIGVNDSAARLFEGLYGVEGMSYNSYLLDDERAAVMDSVDEAFVDEWLNNIEKELKGRAPDYLIVQHMEPDHSAGILQFAEKYPQAFIVSSFKSFVMMKQLFGTEFADRRMIVKENDELSLGKSVLVFKEAPMVHWPEVIMTYEKSSGTLFSADAFGRFGELQSGEEWAKEARRYYFAIVGKYGRQVQNALKKLSALKIQRICPLHGNVLTDNLSYYLGLYGRWASYEPEERGVLIAYTTVYGNTKRAARLLYETLLQKGKACTLVGLSPCDRTPALADAFRFDKLVLATTTYNGGVFPIMETFIRDLLERGFCNRTVGLMENGSWSPVAARQMRALLAPAKELTFLPTVVSVRGALDTDSRGQIERLVEEL